MCAERSYFISAEQVILLLLASLGTGPLFQVSLYSQGLGCVLNLNPQVPIIALQAAMPLKDMALSTGAFIFLR